MVMLDNKEKDEGNQLETLSAARFIKTKVHKKILAGHDLVWSKTLGEQMPSLKMNILAFDLHHACFQILLWKIANENAEGIQD